MTNALLISVGSAPFSFYLHTCRPIIERYNLHQCYPVCYRLGKEHILTDAGEDEALMEPIPLGDVPKAIDKPSVVPDLSVFEERHGDSDDTSSTTSDSDTSTDQADLETVEIPENEVEQLLAAIKAPLTSEQQEFQDLHEIMKHLPHKHMKAAAKRGIIPKKFANITPPLCPGCIFGRQTCRRWKGRGKNKHPIRKADENFSGANTSTDQLVSSHPGLIPQRAGRRLKARYYGATIYVDHHSDMTHGTLMQDFTAEATVESKHDYERMAAQHGITIKKYHADNGRYSDPLFLQDIKAYGQILRGRRSPPEWDC